ncbi:MAG: NfeD family protein, partial [Cellulosilyticaceae bacterium]
TPKNIDDLIGTTGVVIHPINIEPGQNGKVKLDGETWIATTTGNNTIQKGQQVTINEIRGIRLIVTPTN